MADFGDPSLFDEFDKERDASDKILLSEKVISDRSDTTPGSQIQGDDKQRDAQISTGETDRESPASSNDDSHNEMLETDTRSFEKSLSSSSSTRKQLVDLKVDYEKAIASNILLIRIHGLHLTHSQTDN